MSSHLTLLLILLPFSFGFIVFRLTFTKIHKRSFTSLITGRSTIDWKRIWLGFGFWIISASLLTLLLVPDLSNAYQFNLNQFIPLAIIVLILMPLQTSIEEILFRGYLMQGIGKRTKTAIIPLLISSLLFAAAHLANPEFQHGFLKVIPAYLLLSFMLGAITIMDNGLELPLGIHAGNNIFTALILSTTDGAVSTASVFQTDLSILFSILPILLPVLILATLIAFGLKYKWKLNQIWKQHHSD